MKDCRSSPELQLHMSTAPVIPLLSVYLEYIIESSLLHWSSSCNWVDPQSLLVLQGITEILQAAELITFLYTVCSMLHSARWVFKCPHGHPHPSINGWCQTTAAVKRSCISQLYPTAAEPTTGIGRAQAFASLVGVGPPLLVLADDTATMRIPRLSNS
ncbi:hypothetical protein BD311DRAFT_501805 [Dichomitus squalens]|uniref:Uncharacterized protein n=1 Tax=Dichomitus squalens TaxID=114155 RepID=A0A4Q9MGY9_9APHY|nr:hypothetical protein BD311DRAFT_501805 [Dichomitus squalens]